MTVPATAFRGVFMPGEDLNGPPPPPRAGGVGRPGAALTPPRHGGSPPELGLNAPRNGARVVTGS